MSKEQQEGDSVETTSTEVTYYKYEVLEGSHLHQGEIIGKGETFISDSPIPKILNRNKDKFRRVTLTAEDLKKIKTAKETSKPSTKKK